MFNVDQIRADFPILQETINGKPLVYLDNGASAQKPKQVIDAISNYYLHEHANIHRGVHTLSQVATAKYEEGRQKLARWINAEKDHEVIFTRGTTEGINLVASSFGQSLKEGDEIMVSHMEHHSNLVPWQMICERTGAQLRVVPISDAGELDMEAYTSLLSEKTKLVAIVHVSNTLGTVNPVKEIIQQAKAVGALTMIDGAQSIPHMRVDVQELDCDFYSFSAHKMYGPTGFGALYGKEAVLDALPPYMGGGDMIKSVTLEKTTYNELPHKFEAGTPSIANGMGMSATIDYLESIDFNGAIAHEQKVHAYAQEQLSEIDGIRFIGEAKHKEGVISFLVGNIHPYDIGVILDQQGIAVRTGHHCTEPLMHRFNIPGTVRASFGMYNTFGEVDALVKGIHKAVKMLS